MIFPTTVPPHPSDADAGDAPAIEFPQANIAAMRVIAGTLATTLGPRASDKLLVADQAEDSDAAPGTRLAGDVAVAADGATILERLPVEHPIAPVLRRMIGPARPGDTGVEGEAMPDGITTRAVLAGALLDRAAGLLDRGLHPQTIVAGYHSARDRAFDELDVARHEFDRFKDPDGVRVATAETAMTGNRPGDPVTRWARLAVDVVDAVGRPSQYSLDVRRTDAGSIADTRLVRGAVLDRTSRVDDAMPRHVSDASVLLLDGHDRGGLQDREATGDVALEIDAPTDVEAFNAARDRRKAAVVDRFEDAGVDVVVTRLGIDDGYRRRLAGAGILGVRGVAPLDLTRVARATGAVPLSDPTDVTPADLGSAGSVRELSVGDRGRRRTERTMLAFEDCPAPETVTVLLRGVSGQVGDQAAMTVRKGAFAVATATGAIGSTSGVVPGGGGIHVRVAQAVRGGATTVDDRTHLAMEAYADALEDVVGTLARNGGRDPLSVVPDLRASHGAGNSWEGLVYPPGTIRDTRDAGVLDPAGIIYDAYLFATDVATLLLRIDDAIDAVTTEEPDAGDTDDVIYDEPAELQERTLQDRD